MSPDTTTPRTDGDDTGPVPAKAAASLQGRAVLVVGCRGRMGAMLCRRGTAAGLDMRGVDMPLTDAVLAPACKDAALVLLCVPAAV
ncbi:MAG: prephenate dehydrogenase/arogenate dehydrogenase family protein, partial [Desulfovibrio sp.]|nr:prephenate dehydrogenase/arogenate dehydrogenase family protein [Desulfovibrio sp.]